MKLNDLRQQYLQHFEAVRERAERETPPKSPDDPELRFVSFDPSHPALEAAILAAIAQSTDIEELAAFTKIDIDNGFFMLPMQSVFNALERRLDLGDSSANAFNAYQFAIVFWIHPSSYYAPLAKDILAAIEQFEEEHAPPEAYEQLRLETVERIHQLQQQGIYVYDPPELWKR